MKPVYYLPDLASRELLDLNCEKPARLAVIGHPVAHSASPQMHQAALDATGIDARYIRLDVEPGEVGQALDLMRKLKFIGCNVTVPHKLEVMAHCKVHPDALALGAVNTIRFDDDLTRGFNTDGPGFAKAIENDFSVSLASLKVAIIGAGGGAGQAIATQCCLVGVEKLILVNRTIDKVNLLAARLRPLFPNTEIISLPFDDPTLKVECKASDLIVNTSSVGLKSTDPSIMPKTHLDRKHLVYDTIYQPPVTPLLSLAQDLGCQTANGRSMLIHQGALAFQHWFSGTDPLRVMEHALCPA